jgi:uncharacterized protein (DUF2237 family)
MKKIGRIFMKAIRNVLGGELQTCSISPMTGYLRNGSCETGPQDLGSHVVCARVTDTFLAFTKAVGNDLTTPVPQVNFPGLKPGDRWCLCALRWKEALDAGVAPSVLLEATHESVLRYVTIEELKCHAIDDH